MNIVTAAQMKQIEEASLAYDLNWARLMENAGSAAAAFIRRTFKTEGLNCLIFCGNGNNGGDGFVVARRLFENGANVLVVLVEGPARSEHAHQMFQKALVLEIPVLSLATDSDKIETCLEHADIVVDAIYGTGFHGSLPPDAAYACRLTNEAIAAVIALDAPSGVECDSGAVANGAVMADFTVAFDSMKPMHLIAKENCGEVETVAIGIPPEAHDGIDYIFSDITSTMVWKHLPVRDPASHKGNFGNLLLVCGSAEFRGAAVLAAKAALRCGVGICCVASTELVCSAVAAHMPEAVFLPLPSTQSGGISYEDSVTMLARRMKWADAIVFGPGLGNTADTRLMLEYLLAHAKVPLIIDADGLNALSVNIHLLQGIKVPCILTPHPGEMARLCGTDIAAVESDRITVAMRFAARCGCDVVLKGHSTIVAPAAGGLYQNHTGNAGLAKGGSGDVLAGMLGAFVAMGVRADMAAAAAVHLHGLAADNLSGHLSQYSMLPGELPAALCEIFRENGR